MGTGFDPSLVDPKQGMLHAALRRNPPLLIFIKFSLLLDSEGSLPGSYIRLFGTRHTICQVPEALKELGM